MTISICHEIVGVQLGTARAEEVATYASSGERIYSGAPLGNAKAEEVETYAPSGERMSHRSRWTSTISTNARICCDVPGLCI